MYHGITYPSVKVVQVQLGTESISFDAPWLHVRVKVAACYFLVRGWFSGGSYRATPNEIVVVPTSHHVTLRYVLKSANEAGDAITWADRGLPLQVGSYGTSSQRGGALG